VPTFVIVIVFVIIFVARWHGGYLNAESRGYLSHYTSDRPILVKLLDCNRTEVNGAYQARELSYVLDYLDYNFCALCARWGFPHYLSLTSYVGLVILALLIASACRNLLGLSLAVTNALLLLFLTHPVVLFLGPVYRSAKIGSAVCLVALCYTVSKCRSPGRPATAQMLLVFLFSFLAAWFDRQGFFLVACGAFLLSLYSGAKRNTEYVVAVALAGVIISQPYGMLTLPKFAYSPGFFLLLAGLVFILFYSLANRNAQWLAGTMCAALAVHQAYNWWIMPAVMKKVVGYRPSFNYQAMDPNFILGRAWTVFGWGAGLFSDNLRWLLGGLPLVPCIALCLIAFWITIRDSDDPAFRYGRVLTMLAGSAMVMVMFSLMVCRESGILHAEQRLMYYPLPSVALISL